MKILSTKKNIPNNAGYIFGNIPWNAFLKTIHMPVDSTRANDFMKMPTLHVGANNKKKFNLKVLPYCILIPTSPASHPREGAGNFESTGPGVDPDILKGGGFSYDSKVSQKCQFYLH